MWKRRAFTLVELLVVIGIVAVLVALLMPALSSARESATRVQCLATLRSMAQAAHAHAAEHRGYMPAAGNQGPMTMGVSATSYGLRDAARRKYIYYKDVNNDDTLRPVPLPIALGVYMGLNADQSGPLEPLNLAKLLATDRLYQPFACRSKPRDQIRPGATLDDGFGVSGPPVWMGYIFNGGMLARLVAPWGETPAGLITRVRRPDVVFLFADGNSIGGRPTYAVSPTSSAHDTLWDESRTGQLDYPRHRGRMNVVFVDGHAETLRVPNPNEGTNNPRDGGDVRRLGVSMGIFD